MRDFMYARVAKSLRLLKLLIKMPRGASVAPVILRILRRRTASNRDTAPGQSAVTDNHH